MLRRCITYAITPVCILVPLMLFYFCDIYYLKVDKERHRIKQTARYRESNGDSRSYFTGGIME